MLDSTILSSIPIHFLDLFGTTIFAVTGALKAIEHKLDVVGVVVLSGVAGLAGGIIRDVVLGLTPPSALVDPSYIIITSITGIGILLLYRYTKNLMRLFLTFDAFGLGIFSLLGANIAFSMFGLNLVIMMFAGIITAVGGGIIRDMLVSEVPLVLRKELYVSVSFVGVLLFFILLYLGVNIIISTIIGIIVITIFRIVAIKYNWNLPRRVSRNTNGV
ncbi:MAG TPA: trimeric intracellular cation channel family protein [Nitrososphaeraceae archaeon]